MKKFESNNEALNELLINNGIDLICNANMEIIISNEDAKRIEELVENMAPAAIQDYTITDIVPKTYEERLVEAGLDSKTRVELTDKVNTIVADILNTDSRLWSINRKISGYGTWRVSLWLNEYHFGQELSERLMSRYFITHDEDKQFTLADFNDIIDEVCQEYAYDKF